MQASIKENKITSFNFFRCLKKITKKIREITNVKIPLDPKYLTF